MPIQKIFKLCLQKNNQYIKIPGQAITSILQKTDLPLPVLASSFNLPKKSNDLVN